MMPNLLMTILLMQLLCCTDVESQREKSGLHESNAAGILRIVSDIATPVGYKRTSVPDSSFAEWLRTLPLKSDRRVFLYDGTLKPNQDAQYAVLNIPVGKKDLQQCADAVMRLRAQYLLDAGRANEIVFADNAGKRYSYSNFRKPDFEQYLETVFAYCGTLSLSKQLKATRGIEAMGVGDVLIRGGSPGHAVIVIDMAENRFGKKLYMLAQSYMPAQDIHILKNPADRVLSPWYELDDNQLIYTPEWTFQAADLRKW